MTGGARGGKEEMVWRDLSVDLKNCEYDEGGVEEMKS